MINQQAHSKILILLLTVIFTFVNLSVVSNVFCSMKDMADCCCKEKTEKKSCCANKVEVKFTKHCVCEIKEAKTEPAELLQNFTINNVSKTLKVFMPAEILFAVNENVKAYSTSNISAFHSPPNEDINTLKCVLRI